MREADKIAPALRNASASVDKTGTSAIVNVWVDPREYAPGTKAWTMCK